MSSTGDFAQRLKAKADEAAAKMDADRHAAQQQLAALAAKKTQRFEKCKTIGTSLIAPRLTEFGKAIGATGTLSRLLNEEAPFVDIGMKFNSTAGMNVRVSISRPQTLAENEPDSVQIYIEMTGTKSSTKHATRYFPDDGNLDDAITNWLESQLEGLVEPCLKLRNSQ
jgi:hypothetical protein